MKKNRLMDIMGAISPDYVNEAAPGKTPTRRERGHARGGRSRMVSLMAAMVALALFSFALGFTVSAMQPTAPAEQPKTGTLLMDIPEMLTYNDFSLLLDRVERGMAAAQNEDNEDLLRHSLKRFEAFYTRQDLQLLSNANAREAMLRIYPITELTAICTVDSLLTKVERDFLYHILVTYAGMTQDELVAVHQTMYDVVGHSDLSEERKNEILQTLPVIPNISVIAPDANYMTDEALAAGKRRMTPALLPYVITAADYERLCASALAKAGVQSVEEAPAQIQNMLNNYTKYPLESDQADGSQLAIDQLFAELTAEMDLYILNPDLSMEARVMLCYRLGVYGDVWAEDAAQMSQNLTDALESTYADRPLVLKRVERIVSHYWGNCCYAKDAVK